MQKRLRLWLEIGELKSLGALGALWELSGSSSQLRILLSHSPLQLHHIIPCPPTNDSLLVASFLVLFGNPSIPEILPQDH